MGFDYKAMLEPLASLAALPMTILNEGSEAARREPLISSIAASTVVPAIPSNRNRIREAGPRYESVLQPLVTLAAMPISFIKEALEAARQEPTLAAIPTYAVLRASPSGIKALGRVPAFLEKIGPCVLR